MSRPMSAKIKDIADILGSEISKNIDIGKGDIDPALIHSSIQLYYILFTTNINKTATNNLSGRKQLPEISYCKTSNGKNYFPNNKINDSYLALKKQTDIIQLTMISNKNNEF